MMRLWIRQHKKALGAGLVLCAAMLPLLALHRKTKKSSGEVPHDEH